MTLLRNESSSPVHSQSDLSVGEQSSEEEEEEEGPKGEENNRADAAEVSLGTRSPETLKNAVKALLDGDIELPDVAEPDLLIIPHMSPVNNSFYVTLQR